MQDVRITPASTSGVPPPPPPPPQQGLLNPASLDFALLSAALEDEVEAPSLGGGAVAAAQQRASAGGAGFAGSFDESILKSAPGSTPRSSAEGWPHVLSTPAPHPLPSAPLTPHWSSNIPAAGAPTPASRPAGSNEPHPSDTQPQRDRTPVHAPNRGGGSAAVPHSDTTASVKSLSGTTPADLLGSVRVVSHRGPAAATTDVGKHGLIGVFRNSSARRGGAGSAFGGSTPRSNDSLDSIARLLHTTRRGSDDGEYEDGEGGQRLQQQPSGEPLTAVDTPMAPAPPPVKAAAPPEAGGVSVGVGGVGLAGVFAASAAYSRQEAEDAARLAAQRREEAQGYSLSFDKPFSRVSESPPRLMRYAVDPDPTSLIGLRRASSGAAGPATPAPTDAPGSPISPRSHGGGGGRAFASAGGSPQTTPPVSAAASAAGPPPTSGGTGEEAEEEEEVEVEGGAVPAAVARVSSHPAWGAAMPADVAGRLTAYDAARVWGGRPPNELVGAPEETLTAPHNGGGPPPQQGEGAPATGGGGLPFARRVSSPVASLGGGGGSGRLSTMQLSPKASSVSRGPQRIQPGVIPHLHTENELYNLSKTRMGRSAYNMEGDKLYDHFYATGKSVLYDADGTPSDGGETLDGSDGEGLDMAAATDDKVEAVSRAIFLLEKEIHGLKASYEGCLRMLSDTMIRQGDLSEAEKAGLLEGGASSASAPFTRHWRDEWMDHESPLDHAADIALDLQHVTKAFREWRGTVEEARDVFDSVHDDFLEYRHGILLRGAEPRWDIERLGSRLTAARAKLEVLLSENCGVPGGHEGAASSPHSANAFLVKLLQEHTGWMSQQQRQSDGTPHPPRARHAKFTPGTPSWLQRDSGSGTAGGDDDAGDSDHQEAASAEEWAASRRRSLEQMPSSPAASSGRAGGVASRDPSRADLLSVGSSRSIAPKTEAALRGSARGGARWGGVGAAHSPSGSSRVPAAVASAGGFARVEDLAATQEGSALNLNFTIKSARSTFNSTKMSRAPVPGPNPSLQEDEAYAQQQQGCYQIGGRPMPKSIMFSVDYSHSTPAKQRRHATVHDMLGGEGVGQMGPPPTAAPTRDAAEGGDAPQQQHPSRVVSFRGGVPSDLPPAVAVQRRPGGANRYSKIFNAPGGSEALLAGGGGGGGGAAGEEVRRKGRRGGAQRRPGGSLWGSNPQLRSGSSDSGSSGGGRGGRSRSYRSYRTPAVAFLGSSGAAEPPPPPPQRFRSWDTPSTASSSVMGRGDHAPAAQQQAYAAAAHTPSFRGGAEAGGGEGEEGGGAQSGSPGWLMPADASAQGSVPRGAGVAYADTDSDTGTVTIAAPDPATRGAGGAVRASFDTLRDAGGGDAAVIADDEAHALQASLRAVLNPQRVPPPPPAPPSSSSGGGGGGSGSAAESSAAPGDAAFERKGFASEQQMRGDPFRPGQCYVMTDAGGVCTSRFLSAAPMGAGGFDAALVLTPFPRAAPSGQPWEGGDGGETLPLSAVCIAESLEPTLAGGFALRVSQRRRVVPLDTDAEEDMARQRVGQRRASGGGVGDAGYSGGANPRLMRRGSGGGGGGGGVSATLDTIDVTYFIQMNRRDATAWLSYIQNWIAV